MTSLRPRCLLLYHFMHPDDVVSARHFDDLATGLVQRGWDVTARPCTRGCRDEAVALAAREAWRGVSFRRVVRPAWRQASAAGRVGNAAWMIGAWSVEALRRPAPDVVVVGSDPVLAASVALPWKRLVPRTRIAHWCFDLYPEAAFEEGLLRRDGLAGRALLRLMAAAYRRCDLVADLGPCMAERLARHGAARATATLTPWALVEPPEPVPADATARRALFGDARLALLYPGNFGRAHAHAELLALAGAMRGDGVRLCFAVRGHRAEDLRRAVPADDRSVSFAPFAAEADLERRLGAADVHVASLRPEWAGLVVPSKFFGSLAVGRPVLFAGSPEADVARFIREHGVGFVLDPTSGAQVAAELRVLARDPARLRALQARCHDVYRRHFSRERVVGEWDRRLRQLLPGAAA